jgi:hypothetical protein
MRIERTCQFRHVQCFSQAAKEAAFFDARIVADGGCFVKVVAATQTPLSTLHQTAGSKPAKGRLRTGFKNLHGASRGKLQQQIIPRNPLN